MDDRDTGIGKLQDFNNNDLFDVEYSITVSTTIRAVRPGLPPVAKTTAVVHYIRAVKGEAIPAGEYLLKRENEINRVKNLASGWCVLSWPY